MIYDIEYYKEKLKEKFNKANHPKAEKRYNHSISVMNKAVEIVERFNLDCDLEKIKVAALLHDYAKFESLERFEEVVLKYNLDKSILKENIKILHSLLGGYIVKEELGIDDPIILKAIEYHTRGALDMDKYAEVIFVADMAEDLRTNEVFDDIKEYAKSSLRLAILEKVNVAYENYKSELNEKLRKKYMEE